ncbi:MAG: hypothetical protein RJA10_2173, partial [Pseudomonadota bacterium]
MAGAAAALLVFSAWAGPPAAAPGPRQLAVLDRAVTDHAEGRLVAARRAFEALARQGVPAAAYNLGVMHIEGELPDASVREARRWFERAAAGGFVSAQVAMGQLHETGRLGRPDLTQAHRWYERAA